jgi:hypothetical protein
MYLLRLLVICYLNLVHLTLRIKIVLDNICVNILQCTVEGYILFFQVRPSPPDSLVGKETYAQVS